MKLRSRFFIWGSLALISWGLSRFNYLFYHSTVEIFTISVAMMLVAVALIVRGKNNIVSRLGSLYAVVLVIDILHTLSFKGMSVFQNWSANQSTQFWILGRSLEALGLALAIVLPNCKRCNIFYRVFVAASGIAGILLVDSGVFPDCYLAETGLTAFKIIMELAIVGVIAFTIFLLMKTGNKEIAPYKNYYLTALFFTALSELLFTNYIDPYGFTNTLGHIFRLISYFVILEGIVVRSFTEPLETLYKNMNTMVEELTNIMGETTEIKNPYTAGRQKRVAALSEEIAKKMHLSGERRKDLVLASRLHDIGTLFVPTDIISKVTPVSQIEYNLIKQHAIKSYELLKGLPLSWRIFEIIRQHHERIDGSGYPRALKGDEMLLEAKILAVADVLEAMNYDRPHRKAPGMEKAIEELKRNSGILYDARVVEVCIEVIDGGFKFDG